MYLGFIFAGHHSTIYTHIYSGGQSADPATGSGPAPAVDTGH